MYKIRINYSSMARTIAREWGEINSTVPTTQDFFYYFSCSGHGGYVVCYDKMTDKQKKDLIEFEGGEDKISFRYYGIDHGRGTARQGSYTPEQIRDYPDRLENVRSTSEAVILS